MIEVMVTDTAGKMMVENDLVDGDGESLEGDG